jgi:response regulator RpfG family c-di-GMP phosphodiesterase
MSDTDWLCVRPKVLYVDDTETACKLLENAFAGSDLAFETRRDPVQALALLNRETFHVVVASYHDHAISALEFLQAAREIRPQAHRVQVAACSDPNDILHAIREASLARFINKTWSVADIFETVTDLAEDVRARLEREALEARCRDLEARVSTLQADLDSLALKHHELVLEVLLTALDFRETDARNHSRRAAAYARLLARQLGVSEAELHILEQGVLLHDLGKIGISDRILLKAGELSDTEWDSMRWHPAVGHGLLSRFTGLSEARTIVLQHHERWDGHGYPAGLSGEQIHRLTRICSLADSLDAMTTDRPYRKALPFDRAWEEIVRCRGSQFDPGVVDSFTGVGRDVWANVVRHHQAEPAVARA